MIEIIPEINLLKSFCSLSFGAQVNDAESLFGKPEEVQILTDDIMDTSCTVYHYWQNGFSLFFDNKNSKQFSSVEVDNETTLLFDESVFTLTEKELIELMKKHNYVLTESEQQEWGEKRLSFDDAGFDCYFENNQFKSINFGIIDDLNSFDFLPN